MANIKTYQIVINGLTESISAVDSLNKQLDALDKKITALQGKAVNVSAASSGGGGGGSRTAELSDEDKLLKQIEATQSKINQADMADYKVLLDKKNELKELVKEQKSMTAEARLSDNSYANTMLGMKEHLADIKAAMQTVDLGDTDTFEKLTKDANELNSKLLEIEKSYGQFGRNVGNYASAAEGFKGLKIEVGGISEEFENARQAYMTLKKEMETLEVKKSLGTITDEETERLKSLIPTVKTLKSTLDDAGKPMDALMDSMQSFVALAQAGKGLAALFGIDGSAIEESIKKLVALQNIMQSLQTIQKQMQTGEGIGKYFSNASAAVDNFVAKITKAKIGVNGLEKSTKAATVAVNAFSTVLKGIGVGVVIYVVSQLINTFGDLVESLRSTTAEEKAAEKVLEKSSDAYAKASAALNVYMAKVNSFNGSIKEEKKLVDELNKKYGEALGTYNTLAQWKEILITKSQTYIEQMKAEAEASAYMELYQDSLKKQIELEKLSNAEGLVGQLVQKQLNEAYAESDYYLDQLLDAQERALRKQKQLNNAFADAVVGIGRIANVISSAATQTNFSGLTISSGSYNKKVESIEKTLQSLRLKVMKEGLNKSLIQLEEERRQTLTKLKSNQEAYLEAEKIFEERRKELIISAREELSKELAKLEEKNYTDRLSMQKQQIQNEIDNYTYLLSTFGEPPAATVTPRYNVISSTTTAVKESLDDMYLAAVETTNRLMMVENDYVSHLSKNLNDRIELFNHYVHYIDNLQEKRIEEKYKLLKESLDLEKQEQERANEKEYQDQLAHYTEMIEQYKETLAAIDNLRDAEGKLADDEKEKEYNQTKQELERLYELQANSYLVYVNTIANIQRESQIKSKKLDQDELKEKSAAEEKKYNYFISQYRNFLSDLNAANNSQPVLNQWGIVNVSKTKKNYEEIRKTALRTLEEIKEAIEGIDKAVGNNILDEDAGKALKSQLRDIGNAASETAIEVQGKLSELGTELWKGINEWIQQVGQATSQIMSSLSEITSNGYEKQIDEQQKYIDKYSDLLNKQKQKTQEYADAVNSIEDELANARGDRRQHLIDQLNAEISAQRESLAEEKRIEKEKEKAEKRKAELEYKQALAEKNMSVAQAKLNAVMAISNAAVNKWPIPAIPMIALATAVGAAQVAAANSQYIPKPSYGDGGVIVGKAHKDGGVPVLGGQAEVEGGEFITNKRTTAQNTPLLEYINSKKKRIDLADMVEFFNDKPRATIKNIRSKFADGGALPSTIDVREQLRDVIVYQDSRPVVVSVVDIERKMEDVRYVRTLAGVGK